MKKHLSTIILVLILIIGLSLLLYPTVANWWNSMHQSYAIADYESVLANMSDEDYTHIFDAAKDYNHRLSQVNFPLMYYDEVDGYYDVLNVSGSGIMAYIDIPKIKVQLPIYHGTSEGVLQIAAGHVEGTSLPIGGEGTHCVLSAHRGLPSARLFTDLDQLREGDVFLLHILDETLTYEVDQILIVLPEDTDALVIEEGRDLCTLVTCTPYGVNSHRLLVRGHRIENAAEAVNVRVTSDAFRVEPMTVAAVLYFPILIIMLSLQSIIDRRKK